jgi:hypothetical protein
VGHRENGVLAIFGPHGVNHADYNRHAQDDEQDAEEEEPPLHACLLRASGLAEPEWEAKDTRLDGRGDRIPLFIRAVTNRGSAQPVDKRLVHVTDYRYENRDRALLSHRASSRQGPEAFRGAQALKISSLGTERLPACAERNAEGPERTARLVRSPEGLRHKCRPVSVRSCRYEQS